MRNELKQLFAQFIQHLNLDCQEYFLNQIDEIIDKYENREE